MFIDRFVHYPQSLHILTLLQEPSFRAAMKNEGSPFPFFELFCSYLKAAAVAAEVSKRMMTHFQTWRAGPTEQVTENTEQAVPITNVT